MKKVEQSKNVYVRPQSEILDLAMKYWTAYVTLWAGLAISYLHVLVLYKSWVRFIQETIFKGITICFSVESILNSRNSNNVSFVIQEQENTFTFGACKRIPRDFAFAGNESQLVKQSSVILIKLYVNLKRNIVHVGMRNISKSHKYICTCIIIKVVIKKTVHWKWPTKYLLK